MAVIILLLLPALVCGAEYVIVDLTATNLTMVPDDLWTNVTGLILVNNGFVAIDSFPFYPDLSNVRLDRNSLEEFPNMTSISTKLSYLWLSDNLIAYINREIIGHLQQLRTLMLDNNKLTSLPDVILTSLTTLYLSGNMLTRCPHLARFCPIINFLFLEDNEISECDKQSFESASRLRNLRLNANQLSYVPDFNGVKTTLRELFLANNPIQTTTGHEFSTLESLQLLDIKKTGALRLPNLLLLPPSLAMIRIPDVKCDDPMLSWVNFLRIGGLAIHPDIDQSLCFKNYTIMLDYRLNRVVSFSHLNTPYNAGRFKSGKHKVSWFSFLTNLEFTSRLMSIT